MRSRPWIVWFIFAVFGLATLACNLSGSPEPPTLVPRATDTPLPTIGYATLSPQELPQQQPSVIVPGVGSDLTSLLNQIESDRLLIHVDALQGFQTRYVNTMNETGNRGLGAAYRYVREQFDAIAQRSSGNFIVQEHTFPLTWDGVDTIQRNVFGYIPGRDIGGGVLVIGAHYDSIMRVQADSMTYAPGANDNASGMAGLIEIARVLASRPHRASIIVVALGAEEIGRVGSIEFVKFLQSRGIAVDAMLNMDIIGSSTGPNGEVDDRTMRVFSAGPDNSPSRQLARAINLIDQNMVPNMELLIQDTVDRQGRYGDHMSFSEAGFAAVRFVETLEDRDRQHTAQDTLDDIQINYLMKTTQTVLTVAVVFADGLPPPRNISLRQTEGAKPNLIWEPIPNATSYLIGLRRPGGLIIDTYFPWPTNSVEWEGFTSSLFGTLVISSVDSSGLMGPPSVEITIP
ncbi:MAG: M20/M25/M40 family metallo-hydrolase [Anaerolineae bacterium]|nr:M20/M25/M40 family metallo-hydrolase [Anaerolineae bacterium]